eukprot:scaffold39271_cov30-Tisochrysis_lutea.AAC.2
MASRGWARVPHTCTEPSHKIRSNLLEQHYHHGRTVAFPSWNVLQNLVVFTRCLLGLKFRRHVITTRERPTSGMKPRDPFSPERLARQWGLSVRVETKG